jgi:protein-S-isoprenylcysteine O-methyltransferase Ste14
MNRTASLLARNLLVTIAVPGLGGVLAPWWILTGGGHASHPALRRRFDGSYEEYRRNAPRWIPRPPRPRG